MVEEEQDESSATTFAMVDMLQASFQAAPVVECVLAMDKVQHARLQKEMAIMRAVVSSLHKLVEQQAARIDALSLSARTTPNGAAQHTTEGEPPCCQVHDAKSTIAYRRATECSH